MGFTEVSEAKGLPVVKEAVTKLKFNQEIKKTEGCKPQKVELTISVDGVAIQDPKTKVSAKYCSPLSQDPACCFAAPDL